jgi:hypothetical protein
MIVYKQWKKSVNSESRLICWRVCWCDGWYLLGIIPLYKREVIQSVLQECPFPLTGAFR